MPGNSEDTAPKDWSECVSQDQLQSVVDNAQKEMTETITKAIIDALIDLKLSNTLERLDKHLSALTNRVAALEVQLPPDQEVHDGSNTGGLEDAVYDADGNVDQAATRQNRLRHRLRTNTTGMGGAQHFNHH
jgi:hypothetical protein